MFGAVVQFLEDDLEGSSLIIADIEASLKLLDQHSHLLETQ